MLIEVSVIKLFRYSKKTKSVMQTDKFISSAISKSFGCKMKRFLLNGCLLLIAGQLNVFGTPFFRIDAVDPLHQTRTTLSINAQIYFGDQDEEAYPIETEFYLLDKSLIEILKNAHFKPEFSDGKERRVTGEDYLEAAAKAFTTEKDEEAKVVAFLVNEAMAKYQQAVVHTNKFGKGKFKSLKTGSYYLFGVGKTNAEVFVWHLPIKIKAGDDSIEINQTDAAVIFSIDD